VAIRLHRSERPFGKADRRAPARSRWRPTKRAVSFACSAYKRGSHPGAARGRRLQPVGTLSTIGHQRARLACGPDRSVRVSSSAARSDAAWHSMADHIGAGGPDGLDGPPSRRDVEETHRQSWRFHSPDDSGLPAASRTASDVSGLRPQRVAHWPGGLRHGAITSHCRIGEPSGACTADDQPLAGGTAEPVGWGTTWARRGGRKAASNDAAGSGRFRQDFCSNSWVKEPALFRRPVDPATRAQGRQIGAWTPAQPLPLGSRASW